MHPHYAALQEMFAPTFLAAATDDERESIKRLAWYSTEFGMIREDGGLEVFGTGLMSGATSSSPRRRARCVTKNPASAPCSATTR
ncbi:hypothetical protein HQ535_15135 [bacterium]|nr:hypothetical protein [bacterium]